MTDIQLITDLKETRRQLEVRGRCIADLRNQEGKVCLDGAILAATVGEVNNTPEDYDRLALTDSRARVVVRTLYEQLPDDHPSFMGRGKSLFLHVPYVALFNFNDDSHTTDEDCFNLIDKALAQVGGLIT
jgi:hypothetical protein